LAAVCASTCTGTRGGDRPRYEYGDAGSTVRQIHRVFSLTLDLAFRDGRLPRNPATGVRLPRATKGEPVFLTDTQVEQLAEACIDYELFVRASRTAFGRQPRHQPQRVRAVLACGDGPTTWVQRP